jgi:hypothetical protein
MAARRVLASWCGEEMLVAILYLVSLMNIVIRQQKATESATDSTLPRKTHCLLNASIAKQWN